MVTRIAYKAMVERERVDDRQKLSNMLADMES
jgi:hypothetical protein